MQHRPGQAADSGVPSGAPLLRVVIIRVLIILVGSIVSGTILGLSLGYAIAHSAPSPGGTVDVAQSCKGWEARVDLNHKVAPFRTVEIMSTIPGHPGITDGHFDSTFGLIWMASGAEHDISGTVTLEISAGTSPVFTASATLVPAEGCQEVTTTTSSSSTTTSSTSTTSTTTFTPTNPDPEEPQARSSQQVTVMAETGPNRTALLALIGVGALAGGLFIVWRARRAR